jgi:hypothetical protein
MRLRLRALDRGEPDHEMIWLMVTVFAAAAGLSWLWLHLPVPQCNFRALFGIPCFTCGSTRAVLALAHGDFSGAWHFNPLATVALCAITVFDVYAAAVLLSGAPRVRLSFGSARQRRIALSLLLSAGLLNWVYLLVQR